MESLTLLEAASIHEKIRFELNPGTLSPLYVAADASREQGLAPTYLCYRSQGEVWMHSFHISDIPGVEWRDAGSPYGYGGPISSSLDPGFLSAAWGAYTDWMSEHDIVVEFVRFHPLLANERFYGGSVADSRQVVAIELQSGECASGYAPRLRSTLRKAERAGLEYWERPLASGVEQFSAYYRRAMRAIGADSFYDFPDRYFEELSTWSPVKLAACVRAGDSADRWLAASVLIESPDTVEYHLAATNDEGKKVAASSFLLDQAIRSAELRGLKVFYLGGGTNAEPTNSLLFFKAAFSAARWTYRTGSAIFNEQRYEDLKAKFSLEWSRYPDRPIFYRIA